MTARWINLWPGAALSEEEVDRRIEMWHTTGTCGDLHEYLGWTREEYDHWFKTNIIPRRTR